MDFDREALFWTWSWLDQNRHRVAVPGTNQKLSDGMIAVWPDGEPPGVLWTVLKREMADDGMFLDEFEGEWIRRGWLSPDRVRMTISEHHHGWFRRFTNEAVQEMNGEGGQQ